MISPHANIKYPFPYAKNDQYSLNWMWDRPWLEGGERGNEPIQTQHENLTVSDSIIILVTRKSKATSYRDKQLMRHIYDSIFQSHKVLERFLEDMYLKDDISASIHFTATNVLIHIDPEKNSQELKRLRDHAMIFGAAVIKQICEHDRKNDVLEPSVAVVEGPTAEIYLARPSVDKDESDTLFLAKQVVGPACELAHQYAVLAEDSEMIAGSFNKWTDGEMKQYAEKLRCKYERKELSGLSSEPNISSEHVHKVWTYQVKTLEI